ncbi:unnamed protein product [Ceutorhynchus assimilis]|uniref:Elongation of very long chain fatty acids protein n=1 Tax=Ceutorhynchus assimilis TaxID=467358 RepID=A0A9P0DH64_9CUCU|nr:unnamed protein product [Ceutorhynchus assimilis]
MTSIIGYIENFIASREDQRVSGWLFVSSFWPTINIILIYLTSIYIVLPIFMKNREPYKLNTILKFYNIFQIITCAFIVYWCLTSGWIQGDFTIGCQAVDYSSSPRALSLLQGFQWAYFLKITELLETVFFVLRKKNKQVTKLHVYHHSSTLIMNYFICRFVGGGMASVTVIINSLVHILMYTYYYLASLGPAWQKPLEKWKPRLTIVQMGWFGCLGTSDHTDQAWAYTRRISSVALHPFQPEDVLARDDNNLVILVCFTLNVISAL